jgi:hypothetical protein
MSNVFFNGAELFMSTGASATAFVKVDRVQDVRVDYQIPRAQTAVIGRFKYLNDQPVINYTPANMTVDYVMGNKDVPRCLGLLNTTGVAVQIGQGTTVPDWGARNFQLCNAPVTTTTYAGQWDIATGVLKSFSLAGGVGDAVRGSFSVEALDLRQVANVSARTIPSYSGQLVTPENQTLTGIAFAGLGFSGLLVQSFSFQLTFDHAQTFSIGTKYPEKRVTNVAALLQLSAFISGGVNTQVPSLTGYDLGSFLNGQYVLSLQPACGPEPAMTIAMTNPYLLSQSLGVQVGNFTQINLSFGLPLSVVPFECTGAGMGSNVTIT